MMALPPYFLLHYTTCHLWLKCIECAATAQTMPDKRHSSEMALAELRILLRDTKRRATMLEAELQRRTCIHSFAARDVSGPRDNGEHEYVCTNCGIVY